MTLSKESYAFGVYGYPNVAPSPKEFEAIFDCLYKLSKQLGCRLTYIGVEGRGFSDRLVKINESTYLEKLKNGGFPNIESFSLISNPKDSDSPAYDHFLYLAASYSDIDKELIICCVINKSLMSSVSVFEERLLQLSKKVNFDYALGFLSDAEKKPELHILGADNGSLNTSEKASLQRWYVSDPDKKKCYVRGIYPYNIFNHQQLSRDVDGVTLKDYLMSRFSKNEFYELNGSGLFVCNIQEKNISEVIDRVSPALI